MIACELCLVKLFNVLISQYIGQMKIINVFVKS